MMVGDQDLAPCDAQLQCLPGNSCFEGVCIDETEAPKPWGVGPEGGEIHGPNGIVIIIPPGALTDRVDFTVRPASSLTSIGDVRVEGADVVEPVTVNFVQPVTVMIPKADLANDGRSVYFFRAGMSDWKRLDGEPEADYVTGQTMHMGMFVAAE